MRALVQRVRWAKVSVAGRVVGEIGPGFLTLLGVGRGDTRAELEKLLGKIFKLRVFEDDQGKMNRSLVDVGGGHLIVSQFTLYADCSQGNRPGFSAAAAPEEARALKSMKYYGDWDSGYSKQQSTRPQTIGYGLADSPVGQAAWIFEKLWSWSDCDGDPTNVFSYDEMLDNIMMYWLPNNAASSARIYWESFNTAFLASRIDCPIGYSVFPKEIYKAPRSWADRCSTNLIHWGEPAKGGHFAAFEQPEIFVNEVRTCFAKVR